MAGRGTQSDPRDAGMRVELRQGLYGDMAVSRGLLCPSPGPRGGGRRPDRGGIAHASRPAGRMAMPPGLPFWGAVDPVGWVDLVGWAGARTEVGGDGGLGTGAGPRCARVMDQSGSGSRLGAASWEGRIDQLVDWPAAEVVLGTHRERRGG